MTNEELDSIPEMGGFGCREEIRDGKRVRIPVAALAFALFDPVQYLDRHGHRWLVGTYRSQTYKSRLR